MAALCNLPSASICRWVACLTASSNSEHVAHSLKPDNRSFSCAPFYNCNRDEFCTESYRAQKIYTEGSYIVRKISMEFQELGRTAAQKLSRAPNSMLRAWFCCDGVTRPKVELPGFVSGAAKRG